MFQMLERRRSTRVVGLPGNGSRSGQLNRERERVRAGLDSYLNTTGVHIFIVSFIIIISCKVYKYIYDNTQSQFIYTLCLFASIRLFICRKTNECLQINYAG